MQLLAYSFHIRAERPHEPEYKLGFSESVLQGEGLRSSGACGVFSAGVGNLSAMVYLPKVAGTNIRRA
jgi:hypothetical protein